jgi:Phage capsid family
MSAGADLLARGLELSFGGAAAISVPAIAIPAAGFVGEGRLIPAVTAPTSVGATLTPHNVKAIAALTNEMLRSPNAETLIRDALIQSTGPALDRVLFSTAAATPDAPAGILYNIAPLTPSAGANKSETLVDDLQALAVAIGPVSGNGNVVFVASPDTATALRMRLVVPLEWPVLTSASLPPRTVIAIAAAIVVSAVEGAPQIDARRDPSVQWNAAAGVGSMFQADEVALKLYWPICWALRDERGVAWLTGVNW